MAIFIIPVLLVILWPFDTTLINDIFQKALKIGQFVDETTLFNDNRNSVRRAIYVLVHTISNLNNSKAFIENVNSATLKLIWRKKKSTVEWQGWSARPV